MESKKTSCLYFILPPLPAVRLQQPKIISYGSIYITVLSGILNAYQCTESKGSITVNEVPFPSWELTVM